MKVRTMTVVMTMLWMAAVALPVAQAPVTRANTIKVTATIQAIDSTTRTLTLRDDKGNEDTFSVGEGVKRFNELKVGQKVNITYYEGGHMMYIRPSAHAQLKDDLSKFIRQASRPGAVQTSMR